MEATYTDAYPNHASSLSAQGPITFAIDASNSLNLSKSSRIALHAIDQAYALVTKHIGGDKCFSANQINSTVVETTGTVAGAMAAGNHGTANATTAPTATCN